MFVCCAVFEGQDMLFGNHVACRVSGDVREELRDRFDVFPLPSNWTFDVFRPLVLDLKGDDSPVLFVDGLPGSRTNGAARDIKDLKLDESIQF